MADRCYDAVFLENVGGWVGYGDGYGGCVAESSFSSVSAAVQRRFRLAQRRKHCSDLKSEVRKKNEI